MYSINGSDVLIQMKKDYLAEGAMADTADLVVLGAYHGTGNKGDLLFGSFFRIDLFVFLYT